jgi:hypothetical protein
MPWSRSCADVASLTGTVIKYTYLSDNVQAAGTRPSEPVRDEQAGPRVQGAGSGFAAWRSRGHPTSFRRIGKASPPRSTDRADPKLRQSNIPSDSRC